MSNYIDLSKENLQMERNGYIYKLEVFRKDKMTIETKVYKGEEFIQKETIPFAQLTKKLKQIVKR